MRQTPITALLASLLAASAACAAPAPQAAQDLSRYAGKYPFDQVDGVAFTADPLVVAAVRRTVADPDILQDVLVKEDVVATPIQQLSAGRLFVRSFDPAGGGSTNWAILISNDSAKAAVCYSTDAVYGDGGSTWYYEGEVAFTLEGSCPSEADEIENSFGTWPIGAIPG